MLSSHRLCVSLYLERQERRFTGSKMNMHMTRLQHCPVCDMFFPSQPPPHNCNTIPGNGRELNPSFRWCGCLITLDARVLCLIFQTPKAQQWASFLFSRIILAFEPTIWSQFIERFGRANTVLALYICAPSISKQT